MWINVTASNAFKLRLMRLYWFPFTQMAFNEYHVTNPNGIQGSHLFCWSMYHLRFYDVAVDGRYSAVFTAIPACKVFAHPCSFSSHLGNILQTLWLLQLNTYRVGPAANHDILACTHFGYPLSNIVQFCWWPGFVNSKHNTSNNIWNVDSHLSKWTQSHSPGIVDYG